MSLFGRREKSRIAELQARDLVRLDRISDLEKALASAQRDPYLAKRREADMAERIVRLEKQVRAKDAAITLLGEQLDNAIGTNNEGDLDAAGRRETTRRSAAKAGGR
ncbi:hypothetical protein ABZ883_14625 [Streptomyces sp. NPDC046977]|uniref:hypothetical protein n=1 Tax=Streptomyces sp. NPDC046977 TaxID=3154703 RepID=UPI003402947F